MSVTVEITLDDSGKLTVGIDDDPTADPESTQPADSINQALAMAKHLLENPPAEGSGDADDGDGLNMNAGGNGPGGSPMPPSGSNATGGAGDASAALSAGGGPGSAGGAGGGGGGGDAKAMWDELAAQQGPAH